MSANNFFENPILNSPYATPIATPRARGQGGAALLENCRAAYEAKLADACEEVNG